MEKKIYDLAHQPFSPVNVLNEIYDKTGEFPDYSLTSIALLDTDSSSLMFKIDEMGLEKNIDSLADQIITFNSESSPLTKGFMPQLGIQTNKSPINYWQSAYLRDHVSPSLRKLLESIHDSQVSHFARKEFKIAEDPWDNYLFHDARHLIKMICHKEPMPISH